MRIEKLQDANFDLVELKETPHCKKHGAMNKITKDGIWRCISVSGYKLKKAGKQISKVHVETICRAGCAEVKEQPFKIVVVDKDGKCSLESSRRNYL